MNWGEIAWETIKAFGPAIIAWFLAVWTAKRNAKHDKENMLEQLELTKQKNLEAQNQSYKIQFCLSELEKKDLLYEKFMSDLNIVIEGVDRLVNNSEPETFRMVSNAANEALKQLHLLMFNAGTLTSLMQASSNNFQQYSEIITELESQGRNVEKTLHYLIILFSGSEFNQNDFQKHYDRSILYNFEKEIITMQEFIMSTISELFEEMGGDKNAQQK